MSSLHQRSTLLVIWFLVVCVLFASWTTTATSVEDGTELVADMPLLTTDRRNLAAKPVESKQGRKPRAGLRKQKPAPIPASSSSDASSSTTTTSTSTSGTTSGRSAATAISGTTTSTGTGAASTTTTATTTSAASLPGATKKTDTPSVKTAPVLDNSKKLSNSDAVSVGIAKKTVFTSAASSTSTIGSAGTAGTSSAAKVQPRTPGPAGTKAVDASKAFKGLPDNKLKPHPKAGAAAAAARADGAIEGRKHGQGIVQTHKSTAKTAVVHQEPTPEQYKLHTQQHKQFFQYLRQHHCHHLYFEIGYSFYLQSLYEQKEKAVDHVHITNLFSEIFQSKDLPKEKICTLAFHHPGIHTDGHVNYHKLQEYYQTLNYPLVVFTDTLVTTFNGYFTYESKQSSVAQSANSTATHANAIMFEAPRNDSLITVNIDALLHTIFTTWHASSSFHSNSSRVIANMVLDAKDYDLLPQMIGHGFVCRFDHLLAEIVLNSHHNSTLSEDRVARSRKKCRFQETPIKHVASAAKDSSSRSSKLAYFKNLHIV